VEIEGEVGAAAAEVEVKVGAVTAELEFEVGGTASELEGRAEVTGGAVTGAEAAVDESMKEAIFGPGIVYRVSRSMVQMLGKTTP